MDTHQSPQTQEMQPDGPGQTQDTQAADSQKTTTPPIHTNAWHARLQMMRENLLPWVIAGAAIIIGIVLFLFARQFFQPTDGVATPTPTPVDLPTPTPLRPLSAIATTSAFLQLEQEVASLSSEVVSYPIDDTQLTPPVLTLPLGFPDN